MIPLLGSPRRSIDSIIESVISTVIVDGVVGGVRIGVRFPVPNSGCTRCVNCRGTYCRVPGTWAQTAAIRWAPPRGPKSQAAGRSSAGTSFRGCPPGIHQCMRRSTDRCPFWIEWGRVVVVGPVVFVSIGGGQSGQRCVTQVESRGRCWSSTQSWLWARSKAEVKAISRFACGARPCRRCFL